MKRVARNPRRRAATKPSTIAPRDSSIAPDPPDSALTPLAPQPADTPADIELPSRLPSAKALRFIELYVQGGLKDPLAAAKGAGFSKPSVARELVVRYRNLIAAEDFRLGMSRTMDEVEALNGIAGLARSDDDSKIKLAAYRTILEAHGVLNAKGAAQDRSAVTRQLEAMVAELRKTAGSKANGKPPRIRARMQIDVDTQPDDATTVDADVDVTHTPSSAIDTAAITVSHKK